jgi:hypothetical protein
MKRLVVAAAVLFFAPPAEANRPATCADAAKGASTGTFVEVGRFVARLCKLHRWSPSARECFAKLSASNRDPDASYEQMITCVGELTDLQRAEWELAFSEKFLRAPVITVSEMGDSKIEGTRKAGSLTIQPDAKTLVALRADASRTGTIAVYKVCVATNGRVSQVKPTMSSGAVAYDNKVLSTMKQTWKFAARDRETCKPYRFRFAVK